MNMSNDPNYHPSDASLNDDLMQLAKENYLGDPNVVHFLLLNLAKNCVARRGTVPSENASAADMNDCLVLGNIFLGQDPQFAPVPEWNKPGILDEYISRQMGRRCETPQETVALFLVQYICDNYDVYNYAVGGALPEQWMPQVWGLADVAMNALMGAEAATVSEADLEARTEDE